MLELILFMIITQPSLSELELIEPELWFRNNIKSVEILSDEIRKLFF